MTDAVVQASVTNELNTIKLYQALPESTQAERYRFLIDRDGDTKLAIIKLGNYLDWRRQHSYDDGNSCHVFDSWTYATQLALRDDAITTTNSNEELKLSSVDKKCNTRTVDMTLNLPCTLFTFEHEQKKYLLHLPARINTQLASTSVYALSLAIYIDHTLDRSSMEKIILVLMSVPDKVGPISLL